MFHHTPSSLSVGVQFVGPKLQVIMMLGQDARKHNYIVRRGTFQDFGRRALVLMAHIYICMYACVSVYIYICICTYICLYNYTYTS